MRYRDTLRAYHDLYTPLLRVDAPTGMGAAVRMLHEAEAQAEDKTLVILIGGVMERLLGPTRFDEDLAQDVARASELTVRMKQLGRMEQSLRQFMTTCRSKAFMKTLRNAADPNKTVANGDVEKALLSLCTHAVIQEEQKGEDFSSLISFLAGLVATERSGRTETNLRQIAGALFEGRIQVIGRAGVTVKHDR